MSDQTSPRVEGRWAGAASGTGYLGLISFIPSSWAPLREFLIFTAPSVAILVGWGWAYCRAKIIRNLNDNELSDAIVRATTVRDDILGDNNSTQEMKDNAIQAVNDLKAFRVTAVTEHFQRVRADLGKFV